MNGSMSKISASRSVVEDNDTIRWVTTKLNRIQGQVNILEAEVYDDTDLRNDIDQVATTVVEETKARTDEDTRLAELITTVTEQVAAIPP